MMKGNKKKIQNILPEDEPFTYNKPDSSSLTYIVQQSKLHINKNNILFIRIYYIIDSKFIKILNKEINTKL